MTLKQAKQRIEELEKRVKELEMRPYFVPIYQPVPIPITPLNPSDPQWQLPIVICESSGFVN